MIKINNIDSLVLICCIQDNSVLEFKRYYPHEKTERILLRLKYIENEKKKKILLMTAYVYWAMKKEETRVVLTDNGQSTIIVTNMAYTADGLAACTLMTMDCSRHTVIMRSAAWQPSNSVWCSTVPIVMILQAILSAVHWARAIKPSATMQWTACWPIWVAAVIIRLPMMPTAAGWLRLWTVRKFNTATTWTPTGWIHSAVHPCCLMLPGNTLSQGG